MGTESAVGANPAEAVNRGGEAETVAATFAGLTRDFETLIEDTRDAATEPLCQAGYTAYLEAAAPWLREVQEHGTALSGNIQAAGGHAQATDDDAGGGFQTAEDVLAARIDRQTSAYTS